MSAAATWSTEIAPHARAVGAVLYAIGVFSTVHAAVTLCLGGAAWNIPAHACMGLAGLLAILRLHRLFRRRPGVLHWDTGAGAFRLSGHPGPMKLVHAWQGAGWTTLKLRPHDPANPGMHVVKRDVHVVIWKSAATASSWTELALRIAGAPDGEGRHQNKENP